MAGLLQYLAVHILNIPITAKPQLEAQVLQTPIEVSHMQCITGWGCSASGEQAADHHFSKSAKADQLQLHPPASQRLEGTGKDAAKQQ